MGRVPIYITAFAALAVAALLAAVSFGETPGALSDWQALTLGAFQGATELLPISSSGHLILLPWLANWTYLETHDEFNQTFDVALHLGTTVAVVAYFWHDILALLAALGRSIRNRRIADREERIVWFVVVATIPALIIGARSSPSSPTTSVSHGRSRSSSRLSGSSSGSPTAARSAWGWAISV